MARNADVSLVIRAKNEAERTIKSVAEAMEQLNAAQTSVVGSAGKAGSRLEELATGLTALEAVNKKIATSTETSSAAISRQAQALVSTNSQIGERRARVEELTRALDILSREADKAFIGPRRNGLSDSIATAKSELKTAQSDLTKLSSAFDRQLAGLRESRSAFREVQAAQVEAQAAAEAYTRTIAAQTKVLAENRNAAAAQSYFNSKFAPGLGREANTASDRQEIAAVLRVAEARDIAVEKLRQEQAELARVNEARRLYGAIQEQVDRRSGKSARDSADVFAAAAAREDEAQALKAAGIAHQQFEQRVKQGVQAMKEAEAAAEAETAELAQLRQQLNPLAAEEARVARETERLAKWQREGKISAEEQAAATKLLAADLERARIRINGVQGLDSRGRPSMFGLKPYELQNLSFQINDVVTQIASGTSITQTLAQQGGQILQLFPRVGAAIIGAFQAAPVLLGAIAVGLGALVVGLKEVADEADRTRNLTGLLSAIANGANYNVEGLTEAARALDKYGMSAEQALAAVRTFVREGVDPSRLTQFGEAAQNLSEVMGVELKQAVSEVADAFTGNYDAIKKLDNSYNFLTATQRTYIRTLFEEGKAGEARARALEIFSQRQDEAARNMRGPWAEAVREWSAAWSEFKELMAENGWLQSITHELGEIASGISETIKKMRGLRDSADIMSDIMRTRARIAEFESGEHGRPTGFYAQSSLVQLRSELTALEAEYDKAIAKRRELENGKDPKADDPNSQSTKDSNDTLSEMKKERELQRLREEGANAVENLRERAEAFLTAAEQRRRIALAGELAAVKAVGDERVKQAVREAAQEEERLRIRKEQDAFDRANSTADIQTRNFIMAREGFRSRAYWDVNAYRVGYGSDTMTGVDGGVSRVTKNTTTTLEDALRDLDRRIGEFQNVVKTQIGADRFASFSPQQQAAITSVAYNYGSLPDRIIAAVRTGTAEEIGQAIRGLGGDNKGINRARRNLEASAFDNPSPAIEANTAKQIDNYEKRQNALNTSIAEANRLRQLETAELQKQQGLRDTALIQAQVEAAGEKAVAELEKRVAQQNANLQPYERKLELTREQIEATRQAAREEAAAQAASAMTQARLNEVQRPADDLAARRDALREQIAAAREFGQTSIADALVPQLDEVNRQLVEALEKLQAFYAGLTDVQKVQLGLTADQIAAITARIEVAKQQSFEWKTVLGVSAQEISKAFAGAATSAVDRFSQAIAQGKSVASSFGAAFRQMAADVLRNIAQMIIQQQIYNFVLSITKMLGGVGGGTTSAGTDATYGGTLGGIYHKGGIVGSSGSSRLVSPAWFADAARYHTGGIAGLRPNEVPAILERGEEVLTREDPRHRMNGGGQGSGPNIKIVNTLDPGEFVSAGLNSKAGEKAILNFIRNNASAVRGSMGA